MLTSWTKWQLDDPPFAPGSSLAPVPVQDFGHTDPMILDIRSVDQRPLFPSANRVTSEISRQSEAAFGAAY